MAKQRSQMEIMVSTRTLKELYNGKKVLITGHTGFKGSWLTLLLEQWGASVTGYALSPRYENSLFELMCNDFSGNSVLGDVRDKAHLREVVVQSEPAFIFHFAAQPLVRKSYQIPAETFDINVNGTANLLEAVKELTTPCIVIVITTDKVYENKEADILYNETDRLGGYDPYSASKACTELVVNAFRNSFFNPEDFSVHGKVISSVRAGNVIGGGDWSEDRIVPDIVRSLEKGIPVAIRNPAAVRPWQHVLEPLWGYLLLGYHLSLDPLAFQGAYNFGPLPEGHTSVRGLIEKCIQVWGTGSWVDGSSKSTLHEAGLLQLDISKAMQQLGWRPKLSLNENIRWTIDWYKQPTEKRFNFTVEQLKQYQLL